jgi:hypothetical protein
MLYLAAPVDMLAALAQRYTAVVMAATALIKVQTRVAEVVEVPVVMAVLVLLVIVIVALQVVLEGQVMVAVLAAPVV